MSPRLATTIGMAGGEVAYERRLLCEHTELMIMSTRKAKTWSAASRRLRAIQRL